MNGEAIEAEESLSVVLKSILNGSLFYVDERQLDNKDKLVKLFISIRGILNNSNLDIHEIYHVIGKAEENEIELVKSIIDIVNNSW